MAPNRGPWPCPKECDGELAFRARLLQPARLQPGQTRRAYCSVCPAAYLIQADGDGSLSIGDETCRHDRVLQECGDLVCIEATCEFAAHADLITSCCNTNPTDDLQACSQCGTACHVGLTTAEQDQLRVIADLLAGNVRDLPPNAGLTAWEGLCKLLQSLGVHADNLPTPTP